MTVIFARINFRLTTVNRFRAFSKELERTHSETLDGMIDFFEQYKINPFGDLGKDLNGLEVNLKKRINALIAIVKEIEKNQTRPTTAMLQLLFERAPGRTAQQPSLKAAHPQRSDDFFASALKGIELEKENTQLRQQLENVRTDMEFLLTHTKMNTRGLGKTRIILDVPKTAFERIQNTYKTE